MVNIIGEIAAIQIQKKKKGPIQSLEEGYLEKNLGLIGDIHAKGGNRQVSMFSVEAWEEISSLDTIGLCTEKFYENIKVENLKLNMIKIGSKIFIGDTIQEVTEIGKVCYPECKIIMEGKFCSLTRQVIFTKVLRGGEIRIGDSLNI